MLMVCVWGLSVHSSVLTVCESAPLSHPSALFFSISAMLSELKAKGKRLIRRLVWEADTPLKDSVTAMFIECLQNNNSNDTVDLHVQFNYFPSKPTSSVWPHIHILHSLRSQAVVMWAFLFNHEEEIVWMCIELTSPQAICRVSCLGNRFVIDQYGSQYAFSYKQY